MAELLEEGEICVENKEPTDNADAAAFSGIDERLDLVLGQYRKEFEGVISAESLGAMYGGYGSFLLDHHRTSGLSSCSGQQWSASGIQKTREFGTQQTNGQLIGIQKTDDMRFAPLQACPAISGKGLGPEKVSSHMVSLNRMKISAKSSIEFRQENCKVRVSVADVNSQYDRDQENIPCNVNSHVEKAEGTKELMNPAKRQTTRDISCRKRSLKDFQKPIRCPVSSRNILKENNTVSDANNKRKKLSNTTGVKASESVPKTSIRSSEKVSSISRVEESSSSASTVLKEAERLKHYADSLKEGSRLESTEMFFEAAMKILYGASLIEQCNGKTDGYDKVTAAEVYASAAKLYQYCAEEFESYKKMEFSALAYKCIEVSFMRMIYFAHSLQGEQHHELKTGTATPFTSPNSCLENLDNESMVDMIALPKYVKLVQLAQDVNLAMEASRKALDAVAAAQVAPLSKKSSIKTVLDFSFHDVEGLIYRVRKAMKILEN